MPTLYYSSTMSSSSMTKSSLDGYTDTSCSDEGETKGLLWNNNLAKHQSPRNCRHLQCLYASNTLLLATSILMAVLLFRKECNDPSLGVYCTLILFSQRRDRLEADQTMFAAPANGAVKYVEHRFKPALGHPTEYMGFPNDEIDRRWEALFQCRLA